MAALGKGLRGEVLRCKSWSHRPHRGGGRLQSPAEAEASTPFQLHRALPAGPARSPRMLLREVAPVGLGSASPGRLAGLVEDTPGRQEGWALS